MGDDDDDEVIIGEDYASRPKQKSKKKSKKKSKAKPSKKSKRKSKRKSKSKSKSKSKKKSTKSKKSKKKSKKKPKRKSTKRPNRKTTRTPTTTTTTMTTSQSTSSTTTSQSTSATGSTKSSTTAPPVQGVMWRRRRSIQEVENTEDDLDDVASWKDLKTLVSKNAQDGEEDYCLEWLPLLQLTQTTGWIVRLWMYTSEDPADDELETLNELGDEAMDALDSQGAL